MAVIGIDFGNYRSFPCFIKGFKNDDRTAGTIVDLLPDGHSDGIPSAFFYSGEIAKQCREKGIMAPPYYGAKAVSKRATPTSKRIRNMKLHMTEALQIDDWKGNYDELIMMMIQHIVREADQILYQNEREHVTEIFLSHPVQFLTKDIMYLKELAEKATLEDGRHVKVVGMIAEPAAAALYYLTEEIKRGRVAEETTVAVVDIGGGTTDISIVTAYPNGFQAAGGHKKYFRIHKNGAARYNGGSVGGSNFSQVLRGLCSKDKTMQEAISEDNIEAAKIELSKEDATMVMLPNGSSTFIDATDFEQACKPLIDAIVRDTKNVISESPVKPQTIVLTGGGSQIPAIQRAFEAAYPEFGTLTPYNPSRAIAYGAARYGSNTDNVQVSATRDIGIRLKVGAGDDRLHIRCMVKAGTPLPYITEWRESYPLKGQTASTFSVQEAKGSNPDFFNMGSFIEIAAAELEYKAAAEDDAHESRIIINESGWMKMEARDKKDPSNIISCECQLKNIGQF